MNTSNTLAYLRRNFQRWNGLLLYNGSRDWLSMYFDLLELIKQKEIRVEQFGNNHFIVLGTTETIDTWLKVSRGLSHFDTLLLRYAENTRTAIKEVMKVFTGLRKTGKMQMSVRIGILSSWEKFSTEAVHQGVSTYLGLGSYANEDGRKKDEKYCTGIIRRSNVVPQSTSSLTPSIKMPTAVPEFDRRVKCNEAIARRLQEISNPSPEDVEDITRAIESEYGF